MSNSPAEHLPLASDTTTLTPTTVCERSENSLRLLVRKAQRGDEHAWDVLFRRSYPKLLAYASRRLPTSELAKDAAGETMTRAVAGIDRLRFERGGFDAWMYGIARHVVLDTQRTLWREGPGRVPDAADLDSGPSERRDSQRRISPDPPSLWAVRTLGPGDSRASGRRRVVVGGGGGRVGASPRGDSDGAEARVVAAAVRPSCATRAGVRVIDDDRLLERVAAALAPPPVRPSPSELCALRRAVTALRTRLATERSGRIDWADDGVVYLPPAVSPTVASRTRTEACPRLRRATVLFLP